MKKYFLVIFLMLIGGNWFNLVSADEPTYASLKITELLPNPASPQTDANNEFVEIFNPTSQTVDLVGYKVVTGSKDSYKYTFKSTLLEPGKYLAIYSKDTPLVLSNSSGRAKLFDPAGAQIDVTGTYANAPDGQAWAEYSGQWKWTTTPTPSAANVFSQPQPKPKPKPKPSPSSKPKPATNHGPYQLVQITELLPNPAKPQTDANDEFIELYNPNSTKVDLSGYELVVGIKTTHKHQLKDLSIAARNYLVLYSHDSHLNLANSASMAKLLAPDGSQSSASDAYTKAPDGQSWALSDGKWQWSSQPTAGEPNVIVSSTISKPAAVLGSYAYAPPASNVVGNSAKTSTLGIAKTKNLHPLVLAAIGSAAVLYAIYEYRHDLANYIYRLRRHRTARQTSRQIPSRWRSG